MFDFLCSPHRPYDVHKSVMSSCVPVKSMEVGCAKSIWKQIILWDYKFVHNVEMDGAGELVETYLPKHCEK